MDSLLAEVARLWVYVAAKPYCLHRVPVYGVCVRGTCSGTGCLWWMLRRLRDVHVESRSYDSCNEMLCSGVEWCFLLLPADLGLTSVLPFCIVGPRSWAGFLSWKVCHKETRWLGVHKQARTEAGVHQRHTQQTPARQCRSTTLHEPEIANP